MTLVTINMDRYNKATTRIQETRYLDGWPLLTKPQSDHPSWMGLPAYAQVFIRAHYELVINLPGLIEFCSFYLQEYAETNNPAKMTCIEATVLPIYTAITGRKWDVNYFASFGIE